MLIWWQQLVLGAAMHADQAFSGVLWLRGAPNAVSSSCGDVSPTRGVLRRGRSLEATGIFYGMDQKCAIC